MKSYVHGPSRSMLLLVFSAWLSLGLMACSSTSVRPEPAALPEASGKLQVSSVWSYRLAASDTPLQMAVNGSRVVMASTSGVMAQLDADSGKEDWHLDLKTPLRAGVGSDGHRHAVVTADNQLVVIEGGVRLWQQKLPAQTLTAPFVAGQRVFVLSADRSLQAFDGATGQRLWQQQKPSADALVLGQAGVLMAVGDQLIAGHGGRLMAVQPLTGQTKWEVLVGSSRGTNEVERLVDLVAGVDRQGPVLCLRSFQTAVACVDADRGMSLWTRPSQGHQGLDGDEVRVFGVDSDGKMRAWNRTDGQVAWSQEQYRFRELTAPRVWAGAVVFGDAQGRLHLIDRQDGQTLQRRSTDGSAMTVRPVAAGRTLVTINRSGLVMGWRAD